MDEPIAVVDSNEEHSKGLRAMLEGKHYRTTAFNSLPDFETGFRAGSFSVVILDLDTIPIDNRFIRDLKRKDSGLVIIGLSARPFHPELEEAMSSHIYACLGKPVDPDELTYLLKSIYENN